MTDEQIKAAYASMSERDFNALLAEHRMVLIMDTQGLNGESAPAMLWVESKWDVPVREHRDILYVGRG